MGVYSIRSRGTEAHLEVEIELKELTQLESVVSSVVSDKSVVMADEYAREKINIY